MPNQEHWSVKKFRALRPALEQYTGSLITDMIETQEEMEFSDVSLLEAAIFFSPEPIGLAHVYQRGPYVNPEIHKQYLEAACRRGWLEKKADSVYIASQKGREFYKLLAAAYKGGLEEAPSLPEEKLERIGDLMARVVKAASESSQVMHKPALEFTMKEILPADASALQRIQTYCEQVLAFRDDAHMAAWSPYKIEGFIWESFSDVWEGSAGTPAEMAERRPMRGFDEEAYNTAFTVLVERGWIKQIDERYSITQEGQRVREEAEQLTNRYYDEPWETLDAEEARELEELFQLLLEKHQPEPTAA